MGFPSLGVACYTETAYKCSECELYEIGQAWDVLWGNSVFVRIEVNVIDSRTDILLELTTTQASRRAALMQQSRT
jgi:hypothetical protein